MSDELKRLVCYYCTKLPRNAHCGICDHEPSDGPLTNEGAEPVLYTCIGKGGRYEILGFATGAGLTQGEDRTVYRDASTGRLFLRTEADFANRMERIRSKNCTCPSGDGSLRWPCPVHPPEVKALVLPEFNEWYVEANLKMTRGQIEMGSMIWNACLDRVKELNS